MHQEDLYKLSLLEQQAGQIQEQVALVIKKMQELDLLALSLNKIDKSKEKRILASIGEGIYIDTDLRDKDLLVNVGKNIFVHKNIGETRKLIEKQNKLLDELKKKMESDIEKISKELNVLVEKIRNENEQESGEQEKERKKPNQKKNSSKNNV
ncbi:hypothetical protein HYV49_01660 [Candidatus Pacearchaeota archaeon]|nr:hypothetical protein [Candidatus Pacearchaeota archaeon]